MSDESGDFEMPEQLECIQPEWNDEWWKEKPKYPVHAEVMAMFPSGNEPARSSSWGSRSIHFNGFNVDYTHDVCYGTPRAATSPLVAIPVDPSLGGVSSM